MKIDNNFVIRNLPINKDVACNLWNNYISSLMYQTYDHEDKI